ncbi:Hypothetical predicted protein [Olea europaea subsp. europaea]|uniref:Uncharacterized protein n=1 Tax=Olea europaea subsp. europaea TaxID=158383 RepID=A0A8S0RYA3_OLEEU|nr:Hypothetical predicted protein [Olea europaea subsp. europaea]
MLTAYVGSILDAARLQDGRTRMWAPKEILSSMRYPMGMAHRALQLLARVPKSVESISIFPRSILCLPPVKG